MDVAARDNLWRAEKGWMERPSDVSSNEVKYNAQDDMERLSVLQG